MVPMDTANLVARESRRVKELRKQHGLTQEQVSRLLGIAPGTYCKYENGRELKSSHIVLLCAAYGCTPEYLLGLNDEGGELDRSGAAFAAIARKAEEIDGGFTYRLVDEEAKLVESYRRMGYYGRKALMCAASAFEEAFNNIDAEAKAAADG